jgi:hypothetical protein
MAKCDSIDRKETMINAKAGIPLLTLLNYPDSVVVESAIETLANLISYSMDFCNFVVSEGAINPILELITPCSSVIIYEFYYSIKKTII